jgi:hypothetical protein
MFVFRVLSLRIEMTLVKSLYNIIKYCKKYTFFLNFFESLINSNDLEPDADLDPGGKLITDPSDLDPQHCFFITFNSTGTL